MSVLNILFVGSDDVASSIAKKSDSRDVDNYIYKDLKSDGSFSTISILRPNNYPEKPKFKPNTHLRKGSINEWKSVLTEEQINKINTLIPKDWFNKFNWKK
mgnify:CR=1 FL=1